MEEWNTEALKQFFPYRLKKYTAPAKAGELKEDMERFKETGQKARAAFQQIARLVDSQFEQAEAQKVSSWMNQAQIGTPYFFCYFFLKDAEMDEPTFAIRLFEENGEPGLSAELSFMERYATDRSPVLQNQVLNIPLEDPVYYALRGKEVTETVTQEQLDTEKLRKQIAEKTIRKVLVKYDIPDIRRFEEPEALLEAVLDAFEQLKPYYRETQKDLN